MLNRILCFQNEFIENEFIFKYITFIKCYSVILYGEVQFPDMLLYGDKVYTMPTNNFVIH